MKHLSLIARIITPAAMVVFLSYELSQALDVTGWWYVALLVGSIFTAVGVEIVGILAGHTLEGFWRLGDVWRGLLSFVLLLVYTLAAVAILRGNPVLVLVPVVAAIVYILAGLADGLHTAVAWQEADTAVTRQLEHERLRQEQEHARRMELERLRLAHDEKMARIAAKPQPQPRQLARQDTGNLPHDWRQLTRQQRHDLAHLPRDERDGMLPDLAERTRREWHSRLDAIAAQNGNY